MTIPIYKMFIDTWAPVSIVKTDSELQIFDKYFKNVDREAIKLQMMNVSIKEVKDIFETNSARIEGDIYYINKEYDKARYFYNESIKWSTRESLEFGIAVAKRSALFFDSQHYKECLQDVETVLKSEYPKNLLYNIFLLQAKCFLELKMNFEAARSIRRAQENIDEQKMNDDSVTYEITEIKNTLRKQLNENTNKTEDYEFPEPQLKDGENSKFLNASKAVKIGFSTKVGRHVLAESDIKTGDVLFIEEPYAFTSFNVSKIEYNFCALCLKRSVNIIPCTDCITYLYCSDNCRNQDSNHHWECPGVQRKLFSPEQQLCLSILFKASKDDFKTENDSDVYGNKQNNYPFVNKLVTNIDRISEDDLSSYVKQSVYLVLYLINFTDYFDWLYTYPGRPLGTKEELFSFVGGHLLKYFLQIKCNAQDIKDTICGFDDEYISYMKYESVAYGLYVSTSLLNHSCVPNTHQMFDGTKCIIIALTDIPVGTEITINYLISKELENRNDREKELNNYLFTCTCALCFDFRNIKYPFKCPRCKGRAYQILTLQLAKCDDCYLCFNAVNYISCKENTNKLFFIINRDKNYDLLADISVDVSFTQHEYSLIYYRYFQLNMRNNNKEGIIYQALELAKVNMETSRNIYGKFSEEHILSMLVNIYLLIKYCKTLKEKKSSLKMHINEVTDYMKGIIKILQYFLSRNALKRFIIEMMNLFNSISNTGYDYNGFIHTVLHIST